MKVLLLNTTAAVLALGMSAAIAQTSGNTGGGGGAQMPPPAASGGASGGTSGSAPSAPSQMPNRAQSTDGNVGGGASARGEVRPETKGGSSAQGEMKGETKSGSSAQGEMKDQKTGRSAEGEMKGDTKAGTSAEGERKSDTKTGETGRSQDDMKSGRAAAPKELSSEQRTVIRERVIDRADRVNVDFNVSVGAVVPQTVHTHIHVLPPEIIEIYPAYRGYSYIVLSDGRLVIIEPKTYEVVTIISV